MKQPKFAATILGVGLLLTLNTSLGAQAGGTFRATPEPANGQRGVETPRKQPVPVVVPPSTVFHPTFFRQPVVFFNIPAILLSDGTVLADFGMGYEQVTRACGNTVVVQSEPTVIAGNGVVLSHGTSTITTQQSVTSTSARFPILTSVSQTSCFSRDINGRVFIVRQ